MRIAWVLADGRQGAEARAAQAHARHLRSRGHQVDIVIARSSEAPVFPGHWSLPDDTFTIAGAGGPYDVAVASSWRAWYAMFALDARAFARLVIVDERGQGPLAERSLREPGIARAVVRVGLALEESVVAPLGVDEEAFYPAERGDERRVLVAGDGVATRRALAALPPAAEIWRLGDRGPGRLVGPMPLDAVPALLRSCAVLVDVEPGSGLLALEMKATGGKVIAHGDVDLDSAVPGWAPGCAALARVLESAAPLPPWRRDELRAVNALLARDETRDETRHEPPLQALFGSMERHGRRLARRAASRLARAPRATPRRTVARSDGERRPGEPVIFAGRESYFRSAWHDAVAAGWGVAFSVGADAIAAFDELPALVDATGAGTVVAFQPELLTTAPRVVAGLRTRRVRLVAYSTEPMPHDGAAAIHWDQLRRLDALRPARAIDWDLFLHFDPVSLDTLRHEGFPAPRAHPLPVSEALFFPEPVATDLDVCFLGRSTPHREAFLHPIEHRHRTVHVVEGLYDEDARRLMNRARLVVNLHAHAYASFENRCVQALFCGRPLVSEPLSNDLLVAGADYLVARSPGELADHAAAVMGGRLPAPTFDRRRFLVSALRDLLAESRP